MLLRDGFWMTGSCNKKFGPRSVMEQSHLCFCYPYVNGEGKCKGVLVITWSIFRDYFARLLLIGFVMSIPVTFLCVCLKI